MMVRIADRTERDIDYKNDFSVMKKKSSRMLPMQSVMQPVPQRMT